jgi:arginine/ornithine N-succinyltransferase beta subunit
MTNYATLSSQITAISNAISSYIASGTYGSQDLIFLATAVENLGTMLGVNDIVAATSNQISAITTAGNFVVNNETTTSRSLTVSADLNNMVYCTNVGGCSVSVPLFANQAFPVGSTIELLQGSTTQVTVSGAAGVTINNPDGLSKTRGQWSSVLLTNIAQDTWILTGDLGF